MLFSYPQLLHQLKKSHEFFRWTMMVWSVGPGSRDPKVIRPTGSSRGFGVCFRSGFSMILETSLKILPAKLLLLLLFFFFPFFLKPNSIVLHRWRDEVWGNICTPLLKIEAGPRLEATTNLSIVGAWCRRVNWKAWMIFAPCPLWRKLHSCTLSEWDTSGRAWQTLGLQFGVLFQRGWNV